MTTARRAAITSDHNHDRGIAATGVATSHAAAAAAAAASRVAARPQ